MEMCYDGALVMPSSYAVMAEDEMTYTEAGAVYTYYKTAQYASIYFEQKIVYYAACGTSGAALALSTAAVPLAVLGCSSYTALSYMMANNYIAAYNQAEEIRADYGNQKKCKLRETILFDIVVTKASCTIA